MDPNASEQQTHEYPKAEPMASLSFHPFIPWSLGKQPPYLLHLLLEKGLHCLILVLQMSMKLLGLRGDLTLQGRNLLGMVIAVFLELVLQALLFCKQVLYLTLKCLYSVGQVILLHGRLNLC